MSCLMIFYAFNSGSLSELFADADEVSSNILKIEIILS